MNDGLNLRVICDYLETFAPTWLAEPWDNVGLLVGDADQTVRRIMTTLTITPSVVEEAVAAHVDLLVAHHPLPFHASKRLTTETTAGAMLLRLVRHGVAIYSPHTSFDSCRAGINQRLAENLELSAIEPLVVKPAPEEIEHPVGVGRFGMLEESSSLDDLATQAKSLFEVAQVQVIGRGDQPIQKVGLACGSAGGFLEMALAQGCDCFITGETNFHTCLEAEARGIGMILLGHYASERFALRQLAEELATTFPQLAVTASQADRDPVRFV
ncbi:MAG: Nif3-like dinuclear metal center hexameric protein [Pirellulaceae bacterium]